MAKCGKPGCPAQSNAGSAYCAVHKGTPNIVLPAAPMHVQVMEQLEWDRMEAEMQTRARSVSAPPPRALVMGAPSPPPPRRPDQPLSLEDYNLQKNRERSRVTYAAMLESKRTDAQLLAPLIDAFYEIKFAPTFQGYMDEEIGWRNLNSWFSWLSRTMAPAMMVRPIAEEVRDVLRRKALLAGVRDNMFADRYLFELSLYCDAVIMKKDISFIYGQASQVLGPILSPLFAGAIAAAPVAERAAAKLAKKGVEAAAKYGIKKALVERPDYETIPINTKNYDPMRFTLAWLDFVTHEREPDDAVATVLAEFGGRRGCESLYEFLMSANL